MKMTHGVSAVALLLGFGLASATLPAAAQSESDVGNPFAGAAECDTDGNGNMDQRETRDCADQVSTAYAGTDALDEDAFSMALPQGADAEMIFSEADADGDGQLTSEEWSAWQESALAQD